MRMQFTAVSETPDEGEHESDTQRTTTSSLTSIDSTCSSRGSTVQVGGAMSSLLSQAAPPADHFSSFGNPLAEAAAAEAADAAAAATSTTSRDPSGSSVMDTIGHSVGLRLTHGGSAGARGAGLGGAPMGWEPHGAVEDSGVVHQESDGAWRAQWRPLSSPAPPRHVPRPVPPQPAPQLGAPAPPVDRSKQCGSTPPPTCAHAERTKLGGVHAAARACVPTTHDTRPALLCVVPHREHTHTGRCENSHPNLPLERTDT